ncbi:MAG: ABC transporter substrate binding protein, partial [Dehalococcoidia bacterium]|nr:ABC transporter substrate binding protein [Dehalococcoidia bacterium]
MAILMLAFASASCSGPAPQKTYRIGILSWRANAPALDGFKRGLAGLGISEGSNLDIIYRDAEGDQDRLTQFAAELVSAQPDLIYGVMAQGGRAAVKAARDSGPPVVYYTGADPVADGLAESLTRPAGNASGVWVVVPVAKQLEFLSKAAPGSKRVLLFHDEVAAGSAAAADARIAARVLGLTLVETLVKDKDGVRAGLETVTPGEVDAVYNFPSVFEATNASAEAQAALRLRLP